MAFSPDGRWLAASDVKTAWIWDAVSGQSEAHLRQLGGPYFLWDSESDGLITYASWEGLWRWPIRPRLGREEPIGFQIGPPHKLLSPAADRSKGTCRICRCGPENQLLGICGYHNDGFSLIQTDAPAKEIWSGRHPDGMYVAASPDGRWVATGTYREPGRRSSGSPGVCVWEVATQKGVMELPPGDAEVAFSPDGERLVVATGMMGTEQAECRTYRVDTRELECRVPLPRRTSSPPPLAFTPDGGLLAVAISTAEIQLLEPESLTEVATLRSPNPQLITKLAFSPDGSRLAAAASKSVQLWDLRAIRARLEESGLDWQHPAYPPVPPRDARPGIIKVIDPR